MNPKKRMLTFMPMLVFVIGMSLLMAGCSKDNPNPDPGKGGDGQPADTGESQKVVDLSYWSYALNLNNTEGIKNDPVLKYVEDKLKINIKHLTGDLDKIKLLVSTDQAPDIISIPLWPKGSKDFVKDAINEDMFVDIGKLVSANPKKYPVLTKVFQDKNFKFTNKIYAGDENKYVSAWAGNYKQDSNGNPAFNMRIMDKLNLKLPATLDEFVNVLREIKKGEPGVIPFGYLNYKGTCFPCELDPLFFAPNGTNASGMQKDKDGNWYDAAIDPKNKEVWKLLQSLYKEGLFDKEGFTKEAYDHTFNDFAHQKIAVVTNALPNLNQAMYNLVLDQVKKATPDIKFEDIQLLPHPLTGPGGKQYSKGSPLLVDNAIVIPKSSKNPERALEFIEWAFSNEGQTMKFYGLEGVHHTKDSSGKLDINPEAWKKVTDVWGTPEIHGMFVNFTHASGAMMDYENNSWSEAHKKQRFITVERAEHTPSFNYIMNAVSNWKKETYVEIPYYEANVDVSDAMRNTAAKLSEISQRYFVKFFVGELDVDSNWDKFVTEYKAAGADQYVAEYSAAAKKSKESYESIK